MQRTMIKTKSNYKRNLKVNDLTLNPIHSRLFSQNKWWSKEWRAIPRSKIYLHLQTHPDM